MRYTWRVLVLAVGLAVSQPSSARFDYWVLALSWSPEYCASDEARPDSRQCARSREFVVHGLWPQYERGHPEFCDNRSGVPMRISDRVAPLMPDRTLVYYQWRKHGTCSGLGVDDYFTQVEKAVESVLVPSAALARAATQPTSRARLKREFLVANPRLSSRSITLECRGDYLREVRICLDQALRPRPCGNDVREGCPSELRVRASGPDLDRSVNVRPVRH